MKLYIRAVKIEDLEAQNPDIPKKVFKELINVDPTADYDTNRRGKYMPWVVKQYKLGNLTLGERGNKQSVKDALVTFGMRKNDFQYPDINRYGSVEDFMSDFTVVNNRPIQRSERQMQRDAHRQAKAALERGEDADELEEESEDNNKDYRVIAREGDWTVYSPKTWPGSIALAYMGVDKTQDFTERNPDNMKATWCTAGESNDHWYQHYTAKGPLYIFINKTDPINKWQSCPGAALAGESAWFFDKRDREHGKQAFFNFLDEHPIIGKAFERKTENGIQLLGTTITGYDPSATEVIVPEGVTAIPDFSIPRSCTKFVLPASLSTIADNAFANSNVETVEFVHLDSVGKNAFKGSAIKSIDFSKIDKIGDSAFRSCENLTSLANINPRGNFGSSCFSNNNGLTGTVTVKQTMMLHSGVFNNCPNLTVIWDAPDIPDGKNYDIDGIKLLVVDPRKCPNLVACNTKPDGTGYIPMSDHL